MVAQYPAVPPPLLLLTPTIKPLSMDWDDDATERLRGFQSVPAMCTGVAAKHPIQRLPGFGTVSASSPGGGGTAKCADCRRPWNCSGPR
jgi:hypothetical protein